MVASPARDGDSPARERFAELVRAGRPAILTSYAESLAELHNPVATEPGALDQAIRNGSEIIDDVLASVQAGHVLTGSVYRALARTIGESRAQQQVSAGDSLRAAMLFFGITVTSLSRHVSEEPELLPCFVIAIRALDESISIRIRQATIAYTEYLLERVHEAHIGERRRIARDLHDQLGEGLSAAFRQLELHQIANRADPFTSAPRAEMARDALAEAMRRLRVMTSGLRQDPVTSLEKALNTYIDSVADDVGADVQLRVIGDEAWAPPTVIDEAFFVIREAIRNAHTHGAPRLVRVKVTLAPHMLNASIEDDGTGFEPARADSRNTGSGIATMRERAALIGGQLTVASVVGHGTRVELAVSLLGHRNEEQ
jgi:signal transduction histidine kinase